MAELHGFVAADVVAGRVHHQPEPALQDAGAAVSPDDVVIEGQRPLVAVLPAVGKPSVGHPVIGQPAGTPGADPATGGVSVGQVPVGGEQLRRDVLAAVTTAMGAAAS